MRKNLRNPRFLIFIFSLFVGLSSLNPQRALAHVSGKQPFFKINGVYSNLYPVPTSSISDFNLPEDIAAENYVVDQKLKFEFVISQLPVPKNIVDESKFFWDFGDGTKATGLENIHSYGKPGSFLLSIDVQAPTDPQPQLIQSVLLNILPERNYQLPKAIIKVGGKMVSNPLTDVLDEDFSSAMGIDGSESNAKSGEIVSYFWDFGDTTTDVRPVTSHQYSPDLSQVFIVLRVKDNNGFLADNYVEVDNRKLLDKNPVNSPPPAKENLGSKWIPALTIFVFVLILTFILSKFLRKKMTTSS